jgi:serine/threonine-protein kinase
MDVARWTQIQTLFESALERDPDERDAFLQTACADDPDLLAEVRSLLAADAEAHPLLDSLALDAIALPTDLLPDGILPSEGERVGPYRIVRPLGRGGMGAVFLAERADGQFEQRVALKLIRGGAASGQIVRRFQSERQILARLQYPHIARLLDGGLTGDGQPYFAMEYVDGVPLDQYCAAHDSSVEQRVDLMRTVCEAVQYAHRRLVVHRDLKPSNILVTEDGTVKLLDFGIAKMLTGDDDPLGDPALTQTGHAVMTPAYAAPEQVRHAPMTTATDVYALGVVLYELLAGQRPFDLAGHSPAEIERIVSEQMPPPPSTVAPPDRQRAVRGDLDTIVLKTLRKEPERRYASPEQLADDLQRHLDGRPVAAQPDTVGYRTRKFLQRHRAGFAAATAVVLLVAALVSFYTVQLAQERDRAQLEAATATQVSDFLQGLFAVSDPGESAGEDLSARALLDQGAERIEQELADQPVVQARMMQVMGDVYSNLGAFDAAAPLLERSLTLRRDMLDTPPLDVADNLNSLAVLRQETGQYAAADSLFRAALAIQEDQLGPDAPTVAATLHNWGTLLHFQADYDRAESLFQRALAIRTERFGEHDPRTASTLNEIATLRFDQDDLDGAETLYRQTLDVRRAHHERDHPDVAASLNNLAMVLRHRGAFDEAETLYREALAMRERLYDGPHPDVAHTLNHLARLYSNMGEYATAEPIARRALAMRIDVFGEEHVETTASMGNLAGILGGLGQHAEQASYYRRALDIIQATLGPEHPYAAALTYSLASSLHAAGDVADAERSYRQSLTLHRALFPDGHANTAYPLIRLGALLAETDRADEAEPLLREAITLRADALGADHWRVAVARSTLGLCLTEAGRYAEAEPLLVESFETLRDTHGPDDDRVQTARERVVQLYEAWGRTEQMARFMPPA